MPTARARSSTSYRVMEWSSYVGSEVHKTIGPLFNPAVPEAAKVLHRQDRRLSYIEQRLAKTRYLAGAELTIADAYWFVMIGWPPYLEIDLRPYPNLTRYHARIAERPSSLRMKEVIAPAMGRLKLPPFPDDDVTSRDARVT